MRSTSRHRRAGGPLHGSVCARSSLVKPVPRAAATAKPLKRLSALPIFLNRFCPKRCLDPLTTSLHCEPMAGCANRRLSITAGRPRRGLQGHRLWCCWHHSADRQRQQPGPHYKGWNPRLPKDRLSSCPQRVSVAKPLQPSEGPSDCFLSAWLPFIFPVTPGPVERSAAIERLVLNPAESAACRGDRQVVEALVCCQSRQLYSTTRSCRRSGALKAHGIKCSC